MGMTFHKEVKVSTGTYQKNGEEKKRYTKIGAMFVSDDGNSYSIKLDVLPIPNKDGEIWLSCWDKWEDKGSEQQSTQQAPQQQAPAQYQQQAPNPQNDAQIPF